VVNAPHADIEVPCPSKSTSRQHLMLVAKEQPGSGYAYYISLYKEEVNDTRIGQHLLTFGNTVVMRDGDIIHLPDVDLQLEVPNDEATCLA